MDIVSYIYIPVLFARTEKKKKSQKAFGSGFWGQNNHLLTLMQIHLAFAQEAIERSLITCEGTHKALFVSLKHGTVEMKSKPLLSS